jgi:hypothetical protein
MSKPTYIGDFEISKSVAGLPFWNVKYKGTTIETADTKREAINRVDKLKSILEY